MVKNDKYALVRDESIGALRYSADFQFTVANQETAITLIIDVKGWHKKVTGKTEKGYKYEYNRDNRATIIKIKSP